MAGSLTLGRGSWGHLPAGWWRGSWPAVCCGWFVRRSRGSLGESADLWAEPGASRLSAVGEPGVHGDCISVNVHRRPQEIQTERAGSWRRCGSNGRFVASKPLDVRLTSVGRDTAGEGPSKRRSPCGSGGQLPYNRPYAQNRPRGTGAMGVLQQSGRHTARHERAVRRTKIPIARRARSRIGLSAAGQ